MYQTTHILPSVDDEGIVVGQLQYIADHNLKNLNKDVNEIIGLAEKNGTLAFNIDVVKTSIDNECGQFTSNLTPCRETT